jgi:hypothetical protein
MQASYHGVSVKDAIIYDFCAVPVRQMIRNSGIREVIYNMDYPLNSISPVV